MTMPWLNQLQNQLQNQGLSTIGVTDETAREAQRTALDLRVTYPLATAPTGGIRWGVRYAGAPAQMAVGKRQERGKPGPVDPAR